MKSFTLENPIVKIWIDDSGKPYKLEIRHRDFMGYLKI